MFEIKLMYSLLIFGAYKLLEHNNYILDVNFVDFCLNFCFSLLIIDAMIFQFFRNIKILSDQVISGILKRN